MAAFGKAIAAGFPIELDVRLSLDGVPVVFHDGALARMTGLGGTVEGTSWSRIREARLSGGDEGIPPLRKVLERVSGRVPIFVELKSGRCYADLCGAVLAMIEPYDGPLAVMSFDRRVVRWFLNNAPSIICGQLLDDHGLARLRATCGGAMACDRPRPHFLCCYRELFHRQADYRWLRQHGMPLLVWTVRSREEQAALAGLADSVIFEGFDPR